VRAVKAAFKQRASRDEREFALILPAALSF
jgi:hypothetical protein